MPPKGEPVPVTQDMRDILVGGLVGMEQRTGESDASHERGKQAFHAAASRAETPGMLRSDGSAWARAVAVCMVRNCVPRERVDNPQLRQQQACRSAWGEKDAPSGAPRRPKLPPDAGVPARYATLDPRLALPDRRENSSWRGCGAQGESRNEEGSKVSRREVKRWKALEAVFIRTSYSPPRLCQSSRPFSPSPRISSARITIPRRTVAGSALYVTRMHCEACPHGSSSPGKK